MKKFIYLSSALILTAMILTGCGGSADSGGGTAAADLRSIRGILYAPAPAGSAPSRSASSAPAMLPVASAEISAPYATDIRTSTDSQGRFNLLVDMEQYRNWQSENGITGTGETLTLLAEKNDGTAYFTTAIIVDLTGKKDIDLTEALQTQDQNMLLLRAAGKLVVGVSIPAEETLLQVYQDETLVRSMSSSNGFSTNLEPGTYEVRLRLNGYNAITYSARINENETVDLGSPVFATSDMKDHSVIGLRWNSETDREEFARINLATGNFDVMGTVGDLYVWQGESVVEDNQLYVIGWNSDGANKVYKLDMCTGNLLNSRQIGSFDFTLSGFDGSDHLIALRWNSSINKEEFGRLEMQDLNFTVLGTVGDLYTWSGQSVIKGDVLYVFGTNSNDMHKIYSLSLSSGSLLSSTQIEESDLHFSGFDDCGNLIALRWDSGTLKEEYGILDLPSLSFTTLGTVGDLYMWQGQTLVRNHTLYAIGSNLSEKKRLYRIDLTTSTMINTSPVPDFTWCLAKINNND
ncbi:MAG: hypothetical protein PHW04_19090 [Candidatus Wallbacteria bacterium]|nr:hypothetical protein [Candidatus Wallbacteria bacterium]